MGRRVNSFGYRLGVTHFWKFQRGVDISSNIYFILAKSSLYQMVTTLFSFQGYKVLLFSISLGAGNVYITLSVLRVISFSNIRMLKKNSILTGALTFRFYSLKRLFKLKLLLRNISIIVFYGFKFKKIMQLFFCLSKTPLLVNHIWPFITILNRCMVCISGRAVLGLSRRSKSKKRKKLFFSFYRLKLVSKRVESVILALIPKKRVVINPSSVYKLFYFNKRFTNLNLGYRGFWTIKRNFKFFEVIYFSCFFSLSKTIVEVIIDNLSRTKKTHFRFLRFFFFLVGSLYYQEVLPISGIKVLIFGKLNAKMRKQSMSLNLGKLWLSTLTSEVSFNQQDHQTRFGVLGIRVWLSKGLRL